MTNRRGLSFADVLIILAIVLLLAALAVPKFIKAPDFGNEEDDLATNTITAVSQSDETNIETQVLHNQGTNAPDRKRSP
ncbi:MAG: hypothetical protein WCO42_04230 [bacterium]